jgi:hypothetical protein
VALPQDTPATPGSAAHHETPQPFRPNNDQADRASPGHQITSAVAPGQRTQQDLHPASRFSAPPNDQSAPAEQRIPINPIGIHLGGTYGPVGTRRSLSVIMGAASAGRLGRVGQCLSCSGCALTIPGGPLPSSWRTAPASPAWSPTASDPALTATLTSATVRTVVVPVESARRIDAADGLRAAVGGRDPRSWLAPDGSMDTR